MGRPATSSLRRLAFAVAPTLWLSFGVGRHSARADADDSAMAEALFQEGRSLLLARAYELACPKLADSYRLEPATGSLLALALCHERSGKLATAWKEYAEVASRSGEAHGDRENVARDKITQLGAVVSRLAIAVSEADVHAAGITILCDGVSLGREKWGMALPVDAGVHLIEVSADAKQSWRGRISMPSSGENRTVKVPPLAPSAEIRGDTVLEDSATPSSSASATFTAARNAEKVAVHTDPPSGFSSWQVAGIAAAAVGTVGLGLGGVFTIRAVQKNSLSSSGCDGDACFPDAKQARLDARAAGDMATIALIAGASLSTVGLLTYWLGRRTSEPPTPPSTAFVQAVPFGVGNAWGGALQGRF